MIELEYVLSSKHLINLVKLVAMPESHSMLQKRDLRKTIDLNYKTYER